KIARSPGHCPMPSGETSSWGRDMRRAMPGGQVARIMAALIAVVLAAVTTAAAQTLAAATPEAFGQALKARAGKYGAKRASVIRRHDGRIVHGTAIGGADPDVPVHLASLSKAITAACTATLIRDGKLAFDTPISAALNKFIAAHGRLRDPRLA